MTPCCYTLTRVMYEMLRLVFYFPQSWYLLVHTTGATPRLKPLQKRQQKHILDCEQVNSCILAFISWSHTHATVPSCSIHPVLCHLWFHSVTNTKPCSCPHSLWEPWTHILRTRYVIISDRERRNSQNIFWFQHQQFQMCYISLSTESLTPHPAETTTDVMNGTAPEKRLDLEEPGKPPWPERQS